MGREKERLKADPVAVKFYTIRENNKTKYPRITVCIAHYGDDIYCRGLALCSFSEPKNNGKRARQMALGRARKAFVNESHCLPIGRPEAWKVIKACAVNTDLADEITTSGAPFSMCKAQYDVGFTLTEQEKELLTQ